MTTTNVSSTRRQFLRTSSTLSLAVSLPSALLAQSNQTTEPEVPSAATLRKFSRDGRTLPFSGNTIICHLPQESPLRDAVADLREAHAAGPYAHKLALLPVHSYHMTVFGGADDQGRSAHSWPANIPIDATMAECNRIMLQRLASFHTQIELPIRVTIAAQETIQLTTSTSLRVYPADKTENLKLRHLRDRLAEVFQFRAADHDVYAFHISIAYHVSPFTPPEREAFQAVLQQHVPRIIAAQPIIELGQPEYCTFENMERYDIRQILRS